MLRKFREKRPSRHSSRAPPAKNLGRKHRLIQIVRPKVAGGTSIEPGDVGPLAVRGVAPELGAAKNLPNRPLLDWALAVRAATARLKEKLNIAECGNIPELREMAEELAVFICAYGKLAEEVGRMEAREANAAKVHNPT
jgi:hypothetical protein